MVSVSGACCQHAIALAQNPEGRERVPLWTSANTRRDACDGVQTRPETMALSPQHGRRHGRVVARALSFLSIFRGIGLAPDFGVSFLHD